MVGAGTGIVALTIGALRPASDVDDNPGTIFTTDLGTLRATHILCIYILKSSSICHASFGV